MAESTTQSIGRQTEQLAEAHLNSRGLSTLARNYSCRYGEIDLVMLDNATLVFVEVRYRRPGCFARSIASVNTGKQHKLARAAAMFLVAHPDFCDHAVRFDIVGMDGPDIREFRLQWLKDAFRPEEN